MNTATKEGKMQKGGNNGLPTTNPPTELRPKEAPPKPIPHPLIHETEGGISERWENVVSFVIAFTITGLILTIAIISNIQRNSKPIVSSSIVELVEKERITK